MGLPWFSCIEFINFQHACIFANINIPDTVFQRSSRMNSRSTRAFLSMFGIRRTPSRDISCETQKKSRHRRPPLFPKTLHERVRKGSPFSALALLMLGIFANNHHATFTLDDFAFFANGLYRGTNLHVVFLHSYGQSIRPFGIPFSPCCAT